MNYFSKEIIKIRKAISIGRDSDTIACIAGGITQAYYGEIPAHIVDRVRLILDYGLKKFWTGLMKNMVL